MVQLALDDSYEVRQLGLESAELDFYVDVAGIVDQTSNSYFGLFGVTYEERLAESYVANLENALHLVEEAAGTDLQSPRRESDTAGDFLSAYLGRQRALLRLEEMTYYDFEYPIPLLERFGITEIEAQLNPDGT